nr:hypothetical protein [Tanacetum cinerariifolium]
AAKAQKAVQDARQGVNELREEGMRQPNVNLEQARTNYSALQSNPKATELAALETKDASEWLDKADAAYRNNDDQKKTAENDLKNASAQRAQARLDARDAQIKALQNSLNAKQTERGTLVTFGDVLFDLNKAELKSSGLVNVNKLAQFLSENPDRKVIVEGYTDSTGSAAYNDSLSERRANSVRMALIKMGVGPERIVAQGYGKEYPVADNASASGRAMNRRVEVTISNDNQPVAPRSSMQVIGDFAQPAQAVEVLRIVQITNHDLAPGGVAEGLNMRPAGQLQHSRQRRSLIQADAVVQRHLRRPLEGPGEPGCAEGITRHLAVACRNAIKHQRFDPRALLRMFGQVVHGQRPANTLAEDHQRLALHFGCGVQPVKSRVDVLVDGR